MPVAMRLAANAPRFASSLLFASPQLRLGLAAVAWLSAAKVIWDASQQKWLEINDGFSDPPGIYSIYDGAYPASSADGACSAIKNYISQVYVRHELVPYTEYGYSYRCVGYWRYQSGNSDEYTQSVPVNFTKLPCPPGSEGPGGKCKNATTRPLTKEEFEKKLAPEIWSPQNPGIVPDNFPEALPPGTPLPVDDPIINPTPGTNPQHQPLFVPTGDPVPNPSYDPQKAPSPENQPWIQPGTRITPSPTPDQPWRVDVTPVSRPQPGPEPVIDTPENPAPGKDPADKPTPEDQKSLCEKHPDIVACAKMDDVNPDTVKDKQKTIEITPKTGWGSESASCPAPKSITVGTQTIEFSYQLFCDFASGIRPIIIALAWLSAAAMVITAARRSS